MPSRFTTGYLPLCGLLGYTCLLHHDGLGRAPAPPGPGHNDHHANVRGADYYR